MRAQACLWNDTAVAGPDLPILAGPRDADVAIVGAGFAGLSTALTLAEQGSSVVVLEAGEIGDAASGRNGGQVIAGLRHFPEELVETYGRDRGRRLYEFGARTADDAFALIARHRLDCEAAQEGWINVTDAPSGLDMVRRRVAAWRAHGAPARELSRAELRELIGTDAYLGGWIDPRGGTVQPLSLVRELARAARGAGAEVFVHSRVVDIARAGRDWRVSTGAGSIVARRVLLATNALTGPLNPPLARSFLPVWSYQIATGPLPDAITPIRTGAAISDSRRVLRYFRRDRQGRVIVGGKGTSGGPKGPGSFNLQRLTLARLYPALASMEPTYYWGGQVSVTIDRLPRFFVLDDGLFATLACNGKGVAWNLALGPVLAAALSGVDPDSLPLPPARPPAPIPFHRLKRVYAAAGSTWLRLRDMIERQTPVRT